VARDLDRRRDARRATCEDEVARHANRSVGDTWGGL
jgi:hypothetical protein